MTTISPVSDSELSENDNNNQAIDLINFILTLLSKEPKSSKMLNLISSKYFKTSKSSNKSIETNKQILHDEIDKIKKENIQEKENLQQQINLLIKDKNDYKNKIEGYVNTIDKYNNQAAQMHLLHNKTVSEKEIQISELIAENHKLRKE